MSAGTRQNPIPSKNLPYRSCKPFKPFKSFKLFKPFALIAHLETSLS